MPEFLWLSSPVAAVLIWVLSWKVIARWWQMWRNRKADDTQRDALAPFATGLGGTVVSGDEAAAWSVELQGPLEQEVDGFTEKLKQRSKPRFDLALDFRRGQWHVRVSQASMRQQTGNGVGRLFEHRIEVATSLLAPMRILRHVQTSFQGHEATRRGAPAPPRTAELSRSEWLPLRLPHPMDGEFAICASDLSAAARSFTVETLEWFLSQLDELPVLTNGRFMFLTFESGLVYATFRDRIDPASLVSHVDTIVGLLERMPDPRPRHPAATA
jgi:hypothetical protein